MRPFKAGLVYFLLVFALGWVLGPTRELWAVPRFGPVRALLFEAVIMLIAMIVSSWWVMRGFDVPRTLGSTIPMGLVALAIFVPARGCPMGTRVIPTRISCELRDRSRRRFGGYVPAVCCNAVSRHAISRRARRSDLLSLLVHANGRDAMVYRKDRVVWGSVLFRTTNPEVIEGAIVRRTERFTLD